jgi:hypothetical protein
MAQLVQWNNTRDRTSVLYQKGGPGNPFKLFSLEGDFGAVSGGGTGVTSRWGTNDQGNSRYIGGVRGGDPARLTFDLMARINLNDLLALEKLLKCPGTAIALQRCGEISDFTDFEGGKVAWDSFADGQNTSDKLRDNATGTQADIMESFAMSAGFQEWLVNVRHNDESGSVTDSPINKMVHVGVEACADDCRENSDEEDEFWFVTDSDTTPGYQGVGTPLFGWTRNRGVNWTVDYINVGAGSNALDVVRVGSYAVAALDNAGVAYALIDDLYQEVAAPWNIAAWPTAGQYPNALSNAGNFLLAVGDGGYIWQSTDGGFTWTELSAAGLTANNLNDVELADENSGWIVGASATLIRFSRGTVSLIPNVVVRASDNTTSNLSDNITVCDIPQDRTKQLYFATDAGRIYYTKNTRLSTPEFRQVTFPDMGEGSISDLIFSSFRGGVMWILQRNAAGKDRVIRDLSGGGGSAEMMDVVDSYTDPGNNGINSIAPANLNFAFTGGELNLTNAFIGKVDLV